MTFLSSALLVMLNASAADLQCRVLDGAPFPCLVAYRTDTSVPVLHVQERPIFGNGFE